MQNNTDLSPHVNYRKGAHISPVSDVIKSVILSDLIHVNTRRCAPKVNMYIYMVEGYLI